ncbi:hypothetical protein KRX54_05120 [Actinomycetaceae bacterium TAE3-ERU4]|nr:hypothetical protein [Actinomycetaceae bacterium TAE3-ERU4]
MTDTERRIRAAHFGAADVLSGLEELEKIICAPEVRMGIEPFNEVSRYSIPAGFLPVLETLISLGKKAPSDLCGNLSNLTSAMSLAAREAARGQSGMRLAYALNLFAQVSDGKDYLTAVEIFHLIDDIFQNIGKEISGSYVQTLLKNGISGGTLGADRSVSEAFLATFQVLHAAASMGEESLQEADGTESGTQILEASTVAFLLLSAAFYLGLQTPTEEEKKQVRQSLDWALSDLPRVKTPAPITRRAQRLSCCIFELEGPPGVYADYCSKSRSKDPLWKVGGSDPFGFENWTVIHRALEPTNEIPDIAQKQDLLILSPQSPTILSDFAPLESDLGPKVVFLHRRRKRLRPCVLALTRSLDVARELVAMGINVFLNPTSDKKIKGILRTLREPMVLLSADRESDKLIDQCIQTAKDSLVVGKMGTELELLHAGAHASLPIYSADIEETLKAYQLALENAHQTYWQVEVENIEELVGLESLLKSQIYTHPDGNLRVLLPQGTDALTYSKVENLLPRNLDLMAQVTFYEGGNRPLVVSYTW